MMYGVIKSYDMDDQYGYLLDLDTNKSYRFAFRDCEQSIIPLITDDMFVTFELKPAPRGYKAVNIDLMNENSFLYQVPHKFLSSKLLHIEGWNLHQIPDWYVMASGSSPDEAKEAVCSKCREIGATGVVALTYQKSTGSDGNYRFTIHHYTGAPVMLTRKHPRGTLFAHELGDLNGHLTKLKASCKSKTRTAFIVRVGLIILLSILGFGFLGEFGGFIGFVLGLIFVPRKTYGEWLQRYIPARKQSTGEEWKSL